MKCWGFVVAVVLLLSSGAARCEADHAAAVDETFLVTVDGAHVGFARWTWDERAPFEYREATRIETVQGAGRSASIETLAIVPDADGWAWQRRLQAGAVDRRESGRIEDGRWWTSSGPERVLPAGFVLPSRRVERIRVFAGGTSVTESLVYLDLERQRVITTTLARCKGPISTSMRCVEWRTVPVAAPERWYFDADGALLRVERQFAGLSLTLERCTDDCNRRVARPLDVVGRMVVASPHRIPRSAAQATLRYVLARADGQPVQVAVTGEQALAMDGPRAVVTVCARCGEATPETARSLAPYLQANAWVRSDAPAIRRFSRQAGRSDQPLDVRMRRLASLVRKRMHNGADFLGYADALQALRSGRGDCTEYAVLLAALARAQDIPARVVVGMVYSSRFTGQKDAFSPHAWVQAYDGTRWVSYDAAFDGFDATHVALATGTGEPGAMYDAYVQLQQLRIERLGVVAP